MLRTELPPLSKTRYTAGLQCLKRLYFECYEPERAAPRSAGQEALFATGTAVGALARELYPRGVLVDEDHLHHADAVTRTAQLLERADVNAIFEAAFTEDDVRVRVDVLVRAGGGLWDLIEVKSSTSLRDVHIDDVAIQLLTVERAGLSIRTAAVALIDRTYVYAGGAHRLDQLFAIEDVTAAARERMAGSPARLTEMRHALASQIAPDVDIGAHCTHPYRCAFFDSCRVSEPQWSVEQLPGMRATRIEELRRDGQRSIADLPASVALNEVQARVRDAVQSRRPWVSEGLASKLATLAPPVHYVDFETISPAVPLFAGTRPYELLPFQWSDHVVGRDGKVSAAAFLATGFDDPRRGFAESLCEQLTGAGTLVVYSRFEESRLRALIEALPDLGSRLQAVLDVPRVDLHEVVRAGYYHADFRGSFSLKAVLPVLVPRLGYGDLAIQGGDVASLSFLQTLNPDMPDPERERLRRDLLAYCARDTEAMLRIVEALRRVTRPGRWRSAPFVVVQRLWRRIARPPS